MDRKEHLILIHGQDKTGEIRSCRYNNDTKKYDIIYNASEKIYTYLGSAVAWYRNPTVQMPATVQISHGERVLFKIEDIRIFCDPSTEYWLICFTDKSLRLYPRTELHIVTSCLTESRAENCMDYLRQIATLNDLKNKDGEKLLEKKYKKLDFVGSHTAMSLYLNPTGHKPQQKNTSLMIFPFGGNASQFRGVEAALNNQISVIQGPPGTGKTQTILNIIANLLAENKTVQIVSNNNAAIGNVLEKLALPKCNMEFLVAALGNGENKKQFIENQEGKYPDLTSWELQEDGEGELRQTIQTLVSEVSENFDKQERLAVARLELDALLLEIQYFEAYIKEVDAPWAMMKPRRMAKSKKLMLLWQECEGFSEKEQSISFWFKIKSILVYGISHWKFYKDNTAGIITLLQGLFYQAKKKELEEEVASLSQYLNARDALGKMDELTQLSMTYLRGQLYRRYGNRATRTRFQEEDIWKNGCEVVKEYPIVLSTTFSSRSSLNDVVYDYLIMDESSQVDIATGALALSCAKSAVIVGDLKQLPNIVSNETRKRSDAIFHSYKLHEGYSFSDNSFLKSICSVLPEVKQTLLREHYRCHPKIIGFCNQKFYEGALVVMTEDGGEDDTLSVFKTNQGNHRRDNMNQRQIDVTLEEAFPLIGNEVPEEIGVITPYRDQVAAIAGQLKNDKVEVDTVHKFQGREKDIIFLTTVDDMVTDFSDDPYLLNVAISRAKKKLCLIVSGNDQPTNSNISDLIAYIEYHNFKVVNSEIHSVFDLLYQQYTQERMDFLKKHGHISAYDSENLMYGAIVELLKSRGQSSLAVVSHQPLRMLIRDFKHLDERERQYVMNARTHVDFLIYSRVSKRPILAIEVDGFHYHKPSTRQHERDHMKDHILKCYGIPLLRFSTAGSGEIEKIQKALDTLE